jgi:translation elongation factor EF-4
MGRMSMVYDGQEANDLSKDELIKAILREYEVIFEENTVKAMEEAFRCGFLRGEEYGREDQR